MRRIAAVLALTLLIAACGGGDDTSATTNAADDAMTDQTMTDDAMTDDSMTDDSMTDDAMTDDAMTDDAMTDDAMTDDAMTDDAMTDDAMTDDSMTDDAMTDGHEPVTFTVTITNTSNQSALATPMAPGAYVVHTAMETLFAEGMADRGEGLEALAEDGNPGTLVTSLAAADSVTTAAAFNTPDGASEPGPILPGSSYSFTFDAVPGDYLSFATMFVQSNDWFFATPPNGINLFTGGEPITGDITDMVSLWDAGTEVDETPGEGPNQAPRQSGPNTGDTQGSAIEPVTGYEGSITVTITTG